MFERVFADVPDSRFGCWGRCGGVQGFGLVVVGRDGEVEGCALAEHVHVFCVYLLVCEEYPVTLMSGLERCAGRRPAPG